MMAVTTRSAPTTSEESSATVPRHSTHSEYYTQSWPQHRQSPDRLPVCRCIEATYLLTFLFTYLCCSTFTQHFQRSVFWNCWTTPEKLVALWTTTMQWSRIVQTAAEDTCSETTSLCYISWYHCLQIFLL